MTRDEAQANLKPGLALASGECFRCRGRGSVPTPASAKVLDKMFLAGQYATYPFTEATHKLPRQSCGHCGGTGTEWFYVADHPDQTEAETLGVQAKAWQNMTREIGRLRRERDERTQMLDRVREHRDAQVRALVRIRAASFWARLKWLFTGYRQETS